MMRIVVGVAARDEANQDFQGRYCHEEFRFLALSYRLFTTHGGPTHGRVKISYESILFALRRDRQRQKSNRSRFLLYLIDDSIVNRTRFIKHYCIDNADSLEKAILIDYSTLDGFRIREIFAPSRDGESSRKLPVSRPICRFFFVLVRFPPFTIEIDDTFCALNTSTKHLFFLHSRSVMRLRKTIIYRYFFFITISSYSLRG